MVKCHSVDWLTASKILALAFVVVGLSTVHISAQMSGAASQNGSAPTQEDTTTSTDLFVMFGSDVDRPGLLPRANYNIGIGHTFGFLKKNPIGDELTFGYTYENNGSHGFPHTAYGEHTESVGVMKNFFLPKIKTATGYTWIQSGITSYTGYTHVENRLDSGMSLELVPGWCGQRERRAISMSYQL